MTVTAMLIVVVILMMRSAARGTCLMEESAHDVDETPNEP